MIFLPKTSVLLALLSAFAAVSTLRASDSAAIRLPLQNTGVDTDASGTLAAQIKTAGSTMTVTVAGLTPGASYTIHNNETPEGAFGADAKGRAKVLFSTAGARGSFLFDFDPRGSLVSVRQGGTNILQANVSAPGEPLQSAVTERIEFRGTSSTGKASAQFTGTPTGRRSFSLQLANVTGTNWLVYVDGLPRGQMTSRGSSARISFDTLTNRAGVLPLNFDPRGKVLDIAQGTNLVFSSSLEAKAFLLNFANPNTQIAYIPSTGADTNGTARAKLKVDKEARRKFSVELEDVPVGTYQLLANGLSAANIDVATDDDGTEGEVEFASNDDDSDELPLTFEPINSVFTVQRNATVYFQGPLNFNGNTNGGTNNVPVFIEEILTSTGLDPDAHGDARYEVDDKGRQKFQVEIEDVPVGEYELWVGGILRETIDVEASGDDVQGEIEFQAGDDDSSDPELTFDPRGLLIEVKTNEGTFFSHTFGNGDGTGPSSAEPLLVKLPLFNTGVTAGATAKMKFERDEDGDESFEVEIEDAPVGSHDLWVGATKRATISVAATTSGTEGKVEFEDSPESGQLPLDFNPLGETISIVFNSTTTFQRLLPASP